MSARTPHAKLEPIEHLIERALSPGEHIPWDAVSAFIEGLDAVAANIVELQTSRPADAARMWESFIAGCVAKANDVDGEDELAETARDALCSWIHARQAGGADAMETAETIHRWMDRDDYGFFGSCISPRVAAALNPQGLGAFEVVMRREVATCGSAILKVIAAERGDAEEFERLCGPAGPAPDDCETLARIHVKRRQPEEALRWVERGLAAQQTAGNGAGHSYGIPRLHRELLVALGRDPRALELAWQEFDDAPSVSRLADVLKLTPRRARGAARARALAAALHGDLWRSFRVCLKLGALDSLAVRILAADGGALQAAGAHATDADVRRLRRKHPEAAARLYRALALAPIEGRSTGGYARAIAYVAAARACHEQACDAGEWDQLLAILRTDHKRLHRVQAGLPQVLAGAGPSAQPSFLQAAKAEWEAHPEAEADPP